MRNRRVTVPAKATLTREERALPADRAGRRYLFLDPVPPAVQRRVEHYPALECAECSAPIRHGFVHYALRLLSVQAPSTGPTEPVCRVCADRLFSESGGTVPIWAARARPRRVDDWKARQAGDREPGEEG